MKFSALNLHDDLLRGITDAGFERCTPIQEQSLPESLAGKDLIAQSQTGTGKTAVFILTIFNKLLADDRERPKGARALVMAPTRELAVQLESEATRLGKHCPFRSVAVYGGVDYDKQIGPLKKGVDLVVATPGRMIDLYKSKNLSLDDIEIFIIDEADRMFDMGFAPDIRYIANKLPKDKPRQTMLFSATIDASVHRLASRYMKPDPVFVEIEPEQVTVDKIDQKVLYISNEEKVPVLMALLSRPDIERVIIFTNMKSTAEMLEWKLVGNNFPAKCLTGDVSQSKRQRIIDEMKAGTVKILVATDVVARGLHIEDISHVVNYDLPEEAASYVHRIGRTARAGKSGKAYSLVCEAHAWNLPEIERYIEHKIEVEWVEDSELVEDKTGPYRRRGPRKPEQRAPRKQGQRRSTSEKGTSSRNKPAPQRKVTSPATEKAKTVKERKAAPSKSGGERTFHFKGKKAGSQPFDPEKMEEGKEAATTRDEEGDLDPTKTKGGPEAFRGKKTRKPRPSGPRPAPPRRAETRAAAAPRRDNGKRDKDKKERRLPRSEEERIAYYKKKYGDDFRPRGKKGAGGTPEKKKKVGLFRRILNVFGRSS